MQQLFDKYLMFKNRLEKVYRHLGKQARRQGISCFRVYDHDLPEFPFLVEFYGTRLYVAEYKRRHALSEEAHEVWLEGCLDVMAEVLSVAKEDIYLKLRQRKAGRLGQYQRLDQSRNEFMVEEGGLKFIVNLSDYLDTGLFLDHRITRQLVREQSAGKRILNLFCYTGSFSVYAAAGGAVRIVSVDLSRTYLEWTRRNMELNFGVEDRSEIVHADVKQLLKTLPAESFDIIVMDPPTFSNSKRMEDFLEIQRDHVELIGDCMRLLDKDGLLYFSTNFTKFQLAYDQISATEIRDITKATTPFDFAGLQRQCFRIKK
ncbi:MAG TPA: class I SAM-dependent methyltransferase [Flavisolibacter sp.]|jgi:23S rRNA (cytosine1962-C5)-methyltransferase|nr:class I SAM-dependent methyltransferase [Flavisolibacter sp.]